MVSNPLDAMTYLAVKASKFPRKRVVGMSGVLDSARLSTFIAAELKVSVQDVSAWVLGAHGLNMVVIPRLTTVRGQPLTELLPQETIDRLVERTVNGGREIVDLLKVGSAFYAPSAGVARMAEAIVLDKKETCPAPPSSMGSTGLKTRHRRAGKAGQGRHRADNRAEAFRRGKAAFARFRRGRQRAN